MSLSKSWSDATEPAHVAGPIYYVGTKGLAVFLITTKEGHILLDGALPQSAGLIEESIRKLGFKVEDVRQLIISQAHFDHVGTLAQLKRRTGAKLAVMAGDDELLKTGGRADYLFTNRAYHFEEVTPDRVLKDGDVVSLGGVSMKAIHTPGHTKGCTTWVMDVENGGKKYNVVFAGSTTVNPGTRLVKNPSYAGILEDYRKSFTVLEKLEPDIFLGAHAEFFDFEGKRKKAATEGAKAYVDLGGYQKMVREKKAAFEKLVAAEKGN